MWLNVKTVSDLYQIINFDLKLISNCYILNIVATKALDVLCMYICIYIIFMYIYSAYAYTVSEIVVLASQFATQNSLGCYSKLNLGSEFHAKVATHFLHIKLRTLYTLNIIL